MIYNNISKLNNISPKMKYLLPNYTNILYILGFGWKYRPILINNDINHCDRFDTIISINTNNDQINITEKIVKNRSNIYIFFNIIYNFIVSCIISWSFIYSIILSIIKHEFKYIADNIFQLLFISQYVSGSIYFSNKHIYDILKYNIRKPLSYTFWVYISLGLSLLFTSLTIILFNLNFEIIIYSGIKNIIIQKWAIILLNILLFVDKFFCYLSFFVNLITFCYVKFHNKGKIKSLNNKLDSYNSNNFSYIISIVTEEFFKMRNEHNTTVEKLNYIFSTANITGLLALYFVIKNINNQKFLIMEIINIVLFLIIEAIYLYSINHLKQNIDNIKEEMVSINFLTKILNKPQEVILMKNDNNNNINGEISYHSKISAIASVKSSETLDWMIMKEILDSEWDTYKFLGFPITDSYIIQKIFGIIITFLIAKDISETLSLSN